ncbi:MAG: ArnT family glycosyltransferase [Acidobacteriota bacterium]
MSLTARIFGTDRNCLLLVLPLAALLFALNLGGRDLWAPDEPRSGEIVREMLEDGSWAILHNNGEPYLEKPPLYFWLAAAFSLPAGRVTEFSVRLPSSLAALLTVLSVFYLGRALFGRRTGALAAVVLATAQEFFMEARWAHTDMLWTLLLTLACLAFYRAHESGGDRRWLTAFYLSMGLATLTKGPLGLLLPILAAAVFLAACRELGFLRRAGLLWGLPVALAPGLAWLASYYLAAGEPFPLGFAFGRMAERYARGVHHAKPFFHTFTSLAVGFMPWAVLLPVAIGHTFPRRRSRGHRSGVYLYTWITVMLSVFAFSVEKRGVYLLPLAPCLALVVGRFWDAALFEWEPPPFLRSSRWSLGAALLVVVLASAHYLPLVRQRSPGLLAPAVLLASILGAATLVSILLLRRAGAAALALYAFGAVACYLVVTLGVFPVLNLYKSARPFCRRVSAIVGSAPLGIYPDYREAYAFYTGRFLDVLRAPGELRTFFGSNLDAFCLIEDRHLEAARTAIDRDPLILDRQEVGHRLMLLVTSAPEGSAPARRARPPGTGR